MNIETKDIVSLAFGTAIGLVAGVGMYWGPLGQFTNEWRAIWNLRKRYKQGEDIMVRAGTDFRPLDSKLKIATVSQNAKFKVWNDEGVGWHHTKSGWKRARVLHVFDPSKGERPDVYRICHLDIV